MSYKETQIQKYLRAQKPHDKKYGPYADIAARNAIPTEDRYPLMIVGVLDSDGAETNTIYGLVGGITNSDWIKVLLERTTYERVFWVSANVAVDNVGTIGDFSTPFGPHGLAGMDTTRDTAIFMPGTYNITEQIDINLPVGNIYYEFMNGAIINFNHATATMLGDNSPTKIISGKGSFIQQGEGILFDNVFSLEFDTITIQSLANSEFIRSQRGNPFLIRGRQIILDIGAVSVLNLSGLLDVDELIAKSAGQFFNIKNVSIGGNHRIGRIKSEGLGLRFDNSGIDNTKISIGRIESKGTALFAVNNTQALNCQIEVGTIDFNAATGFAIDTLGQGTNVRVGTLSVSGGGSGINLASGIKYEVGKISITGGGFAVNTTNSLLQKIFLSVDYIEQLGSQHAVQIHLRNSSTIQPYLVQLRLKHCKATVAGFRALFIKQITGATPTNEVEIKDSLLEAVEIPLEFQLQPGFSDVLFNFKLSDVELYSGDVSNCMITDQNPTKVRCKNVWSNAPIGTGINPVLEGVNVSSEIINI